MEKTIHQVLGHMQANLNYIAEIPHLHGQKPFLQTYKLVTEQVLLHHDLNPHYFNDFSKIVDLDVTFADLYFTPWEKVQKGDRCGAPWETYYGYTATSAGSAFLQVLLGINAHINADLAYSLVKNNYTEADDYDKINDVLCEVMPKLMSFLFFEEHDVVGLAGILMRKFFVYELKHIIVRWRKDAWRHAQLLQNERIEIEDLNRATDELGRLMLGWWQKYFNVWQLPELLWLLNHKARVKLLAK